MKYIAEYLLCLAGAFVLFGIGIIYTTTEPNPLEWRDAIRGLHIWGSIITAAISFAAIRIYETIERQ